MGKLFQPEDCVLSHEGRNPLSVLDRPESGKRVLSTSLVALAAYSGIFSQAVSTEVLAAAPSPTSVLALNCGLELNRSCDAAIARIGTLFNERIRQQVLGSGTDEGYYRRKDLLQKPKPGSNPSEGEIELETSQKPFFEVCSLNGNRFNSYQAEDGANHLGRSCGEPDRIDCRTSTTGEIRAQLIAGTGTRELAHLRGAFLEALDCVSREILDEVKTSRELRMTGTDSSNACQGLVTIYGENRSRLLELASRADPEKKGRCRFTKDGLPEQVGCFAEGALESSDAIFTALMACEAFRRADEGYLALRNALHSDAARRLTWTKHSSDCSDRPTCAAFSSCVHDKFRELIRSESNAMFPRESTAGKCRLLNP